MTYASRMSAVHGKPFANRYEARRFRKHGAAPVRILAAPSALVQQLVTRFFQAPDFPLGTWIATHTTPKRGLEDVVLRQIDAQVREADAILAGA